MLFRSTVATQWSPTFRSGSYPTSGTSSATGRPYDHDQLLTGAGAVTILRDPSGELNGLMRGTTLGSVATTQSYNDFGELATLGAAHGGSALYAEDVSQRDSLGRITRKVETLGGVPTTTDYGYDLAGRLDTVTVDGQLVRDFTYDANGNRLSLAPGDPTPIASTDAQDRLLIVLPPGPAIAARPWSARADGAQATGTPSWVRVDRTLDGVR